MTSRRTQIYLTAAQHRQATRLARERGTTLAAVVREALDRYLETAVDAEVDWDGDPALDLVGCVDLGGTAVTNDDIDTVVYEEEDAWSSPTARDSSPSSTHRSRATQKRRRRGGASRGGGSSS